MTNYSTTQKTDLLDRQAKKKQELFRIMVPIDFTRESYNTLEYALRLARGCKGSIELAPLADSSSLPDSENPLTFRHAYSAMEDRVRRRIESLKEIIRENGVKVMSQRIQYGSSTASLLRGIEKSQHDLVILSNDTVAWNLLSELNASTKTAILVVPLTILPRNPKNIMLVHDGYSINESSLNPLFTIVHYSSKKLTVVDKTNGVIRKTIFKYLLPLDFFEIGVDRQIKIKNNYGRDLKQLVNSFKPDLICQVFRKPTLIRRLLMPWFGPSSVQKFDIPNLIIKCPY